MVFRRTHNCGELRISDVNNSVVLNGWIDSIRNIGKIIFIDLRDRYGITQIVVEKEELVRKAKELRNESVVSIKGLVRKREGNPNKRILTGEIEVVADEINIYSIAEPTPFVIQNDVRATEELRLKYRYLDIRRESIRDKLMLRHKAAFETRRFLNENNFVEVETPFLTKSTPEGARDFLVPSRLNKGKVYALPQSPQLFKQLLMVSGMDKYFQIVRCFRDEDLRLDRQPEFTQIDIEMSFVNQDDVMELTEDLLRHIFRSCVNYEIKEFVRISYKEAIDKYGSDKPDLRFGLKMCDITEIIRKMTGKIKMFDEAIREGGIIKILPIGSNMNLTRAEIERLENEIKSLGAKGLARFRVDSEVDWTLASWTKEIPEEVKKEIISKANIEKGSVVFVQFGDSKLVNNVLSFVRNAIAEKFGLKKRDEYKFVWIYDFPMFEFSEEDKRLVACHHPFTSPKEEDIGFLESEPLNVRANAYDITLNGFEIGGGSIRIHSAELQKRVFKVLGLSETEINSKFGFLIEAFKYGVPPHGGIALGFDRLIMLMSGAESIRDVIAFPKTTSGACLMTDAPSVPEEKQLLEAGIRFIEEVKHE
ncbi:MAG: aspartate--tRNA ligase [Deltaproteobacteria bacterium]|nr:aspartate--tRNA ligase [Deltaproteobacteria bacterium]